MNTLEKYKAILSSVRFHQLLAASILLVMQHYGVIDSYVANVIAGFLASVAAIGTVDRATEPNIVEVDENK